MKNILTILATLSVALTILAGCSGKSPEQRHMADINQSGTSERTFVGSLPGADVAGISYKLTLKTDSRNAGKGTYRLTQTYDSGINPVVEHTHGDFEMLKGTPAGAGRSYLRLIPRDLAAGAPVDTLYMLCTDDSTLTLVGPDLMPAASGLDYSLHLSK